jgi:hypothetical protein
MDQESGKQMIGLLHFQCLFILVLQATLQIKDPDAIVVVMYNR